MIINSFFQKSLKNQVQKLLDLCIEKKLKLAIAESCTGGLLTSLITDIAGSSKILECGLVTYSNQTKIDFLGVSKRNLDKYGAVSQEIANEMLQGILKNCHVDIAIAITGIAGPDGGTENKPVGTVFIGFATLDKNIIKQYNFIGNRSQIRFESVAKSLELAIDNTKLT